MSAHADAIEALWKAVHRRQEQALLASEARDRSLATATQHDNYRAECLHLVEQYEAAIKALEATA